MKKILLLIAILLSLSANAQILTNYQGQIISKNGMLVGAPDGIVFISNQPTTINQVSITLRIDEGRTVQIRWGDGNITTATGIGSNVTYTSTYTSNNSTYIIQIVGDLGYVRRFSTSESTLKFNSTSQLAKLTGLQELQLFSVDFNNLNIDLLPSSLTKLSISLSASKGTILGDISLKPNLIEFDIQNQPNSLTGSITNLVNLTTLYVRGSNTLSGSITNLVNLKIINILGYNTVMGSITNLTKLTNFNIVSSLCNITGSITGLISLVELQLGGIGSISGSIDGIPNLATINVTSQNTLTGSIENTPNINFIQLYGSATLTGSLTSLNKLTFLNVTASSVFSGSISGLTLLNRCTLGANSLSNPLNLSSLGLLVQMSVINNTNLTTFKAPSSTALVAIITLYSNNIDKFDFTNTLNLRGDLRIYNNPNDTSLVLPATLTGYFTRIDAHGNALNQSSVDNLFKKLATYYLTHTPTANLYIDVSGGTNASPTGGGNNADIIAIDAAFSSANKIFTLLTN